ncbi:hypothetical protein AIQ71_08775 [Salmonella enterica]|uniref:Transposase n=1 Tax=Salmonella enterica subsp. arizonae TaxID=59203 RepID=A0A3R0BLZ0_SALER|nr:hypothetical protein [Salmonella enterica]EAC0103495.1 hypothetical protein [Salmonella enterica subsp. arizonae]EAN8392948.1 hypothetical protein [Salmonella enterica subsp. arizonae serovar 13,23:gz51:-]EBF3615748.1 hypothetical protein [Salmonella enterica subsp. arizonae serovar [1],13,23:g,z51:-]EBH8077780.1 hypothetical protein [Salmonella bongori]EBL3324704.1 hypothetical protein [Salmonella enterica subsp. enterica]ECL5967900.1 hypothetical protein [Salmonella enterica subsp. enter
MSNASFYKWRSRFGGKKMYAEECFKAEIIQKAVAKKW